MSQNESNSQEQPRSQDGSMSLDSSTSKHGTTQPAMERYRELVAELPGEEEVRRRAAEGWKLVAIEWQRPTSEPVPVETPYGLRTLGGDTRLIEDPREEEALRVMLSMVIDDRNTLARVAEELNRRDLLTRGGNPWNAESVFNMLPRLVEVAPQFYARSDWRAESPAVPSRS